VAFEQVTDALNLRQKKGSTQPNEYFNIVTTVWRTYTGSNEEVNAWLEGLLTNSLEKYIIAETAFVREMESSTREWTTLYLFQTQSNYRSRDDRALALSNLLRERESQVDRTFESITLQDGTDDIHERRGIGSKSKGIPTRSQPRPEGPGTSTSRSDANVPARQGSNVPVRSQRSIGERTDTLTRQLATAMSAHSAANAAIVPARDL
jgi:hypothetical protein